MYAAEQGMKDLKVWEKYNLLWLHSYVFGLEK